MGTNLYMYNCFPLQISCGKIQSAWKRTLSSTVRVKREPLQEIYQDVTERADTGEHGAYFPNSHDKTKPMWELSGFLRFSPALSLSLQSSFSTFQLTFSENWDFCVRWKEFLKFWLHRVFTVVDLKPKFGVPISS